MELVKWIWVAAITIWVIKILVVWNFPIAAEVDQVELLQRLGMMTALQDRGLSIAVLIIEAGVAVGVTTLAARRLRREIIPWVLVAITASPWLNWSFAFYTKPGFDDSLVKKLSTQELATSVDQTQKEVFESTGKKVLLPAVVRKILFNKVGLALDKTSREVVGLFDFQQWSAPLMAWEITGLSGLPPRGLLPLFYFWEIPIVLYALKKHGRKYWIPMIIAAVPAVIMHKKFLAISGLAILPMIYLVIGKTLQEMPGRLRGVVIAAYVMSMGFFLNTIYVKQEEWRYSRPELYAQAAKWIRGNDKYKSVVMTDRLGSTLLMMDFYGAAGGFLSVREIMAGETARVDTAYVGLPGEIEKMQEARTIEKITGWDEPVYKYGSGLWIATN